MSWYLGLEAMVVPVVESEGQKRGIDRWVFLFCVRSNKQEAKTKNGRQRNRLSRVVSARKAWERKALQNALLQRHTEQKSELRHALAPSKLLAQDLLVVGDFLMRAS